METTIDEQKKQADILVTSIDSKYTLFLQNTIPVVAKRGVIIHTDRLISVTERVFEELNSKYRIEFDL